VGVEQGLLQFLRLSVSLQNNRSTKRWGIGNYKIRPLNYLKLSQKRRKHVHNLLNPIKNSHCRPMSFNISCGLSCSSWSSAIPSFLISYNCFLSFTLSFSIPNLTFCNSSFLFLRSSSSLRLSSNKACLCSNCSCFFLSSSSIKSSLCLKYFFFNWS